MNVPLLDLVAQYDGIKDQVLRAMMTVVERQGFIMGPEVALLETEIARLSSARHAIGCASGTDALLLPLRALDLKPGDEVITTPFTFFATAGAIHNAGGTPVFVDIDPSSFNIAPPAIEAAITSRTRGVVVVHLFGQMAAMESVLPLAQRHGLALIEDACEAVGASYRGRPIGSFPHPAVFAFYPNKQMTTGEGGAIAVSTDEERRLLRSLANQGRADSGGWLEHARFGYTTASTTSRPRSGWPSSKSWTTCLPAGRTLRRGTASCSPASRAPSRR